MSGPISGLSAEPLPRGVGSIGLLVEHQELDDLSDERLVEAGENHEDVHSVDQLLNASLTAVYGATDSLLVGANIPYVRRSNIREPEHIHGATDEVANIGNSEGLGDLRLFGQYRPFGNIERDSHTALILGLKMPTGEHDEEISQEVDGDHGHDDGEHEHGTFETEHQPGSGSWDPFFGIAYSRMWNGLSLHASLLYTLATEGAQDTDLGDSLHYNLAAAYRLTGEAPSHSHDHHSHEHSHAGAVAWDAILEVNGETREKQEIAGVEHDNSGGNVVFVAPGVRAIINERWAAVLSVGIPVVRDLNGTQSEPELRTIASISAGF
jgi:hypothetical protein